jgi:peptidoglycan hydrolase FlgJ
MIAASNPINAQPVEYKNRLDSSTGSAQNKLSENRSKDLKSACRELESLFISQLLKEMRATVHKSGLMDGGQGEEMFTSIMDAELSKTIASNGGLGISDQLYAQLSGKIDNPGQKKLHQEKIIKEYVKTADS